MHWAAYFEDKIFKDFVGVYKTSNKNVCPLNFMIDQSFCLPIAHPQNFIHKIFCLKKILTLLKFLYTKLSSVLRTPVYSPKRTAAFWHNCNYSYKCLLLNYNYIQCDNHVGCGCVMQLGYIRRVQH